MKKVLIITYYWPPSGGAGVQRWVKFAKYLSRLGYKPFVLTVDPKYATYPQLDESLKNDIPKEVEVFYTKAYDPFALYKKVSSNKEVPYGGFANTQKLDFKEKVLRFIRGNFFIPDPRRGWNRFAVKAATKIISENQIDTIITSSPPHSTQLIGLKLKKQLGIKWIADLRDPWIDIFYNKLLYQMRFSVYFNKMLERKVLQGADKVLTVSEDMKRLFCEKTDNMQTRIAVIPNGYDNDDFKKVNLIRDPETFYISYVGTISNDYPIDGFISALTMLDKEIRDKLKLRFVGKLATDHFNKLVKAGLEENIEQLGYVQHNLAIDYMFSSNILLLVIPDIKNNKGILTGKLFEYLASKRPILLLGPTDGDAAKIIHETNSGIMCSYNDVNKIKESILHYYSNSTAIFTEVKPNPNKYSRENLTLDLINKL